jgi:hypothetical protein
VSNLNLIHGKREGRGEILDELSVFAFVGIFHEVAPQGIGYGLYLLIGSFNDVHARLSMSSRDRHRGASKKTQARHAGSFAPRRKFNANLRWGYRYSLAPTR